MAKTCITEKTAARQRWIEQGLQELMLTRRFEEITVTDLCRHLGLSRRSFYRYFSDLEDVLDSLLNSTFQNLAIVPMVPELEDLRQTYEFWVARKGLLDALYNGGQIERLYEFTIRYTDFEPAHAAWKSELRKDTQVFLIGGFMSLIISWYMEGFRKTPEEMARISHRMLYEPFLNGK